MRIIRYTKKPPTFTDKEMNIKLSKAEEKELSNGKGTKEAQK